MTYKLINKNLLPLFPTFVHKATVDDLSLCDKLETCIDELKREDKGEYYKGTKTSNSFVTEDNLHELDAFSELKDLIIKESGSVFDFYSVKRDSHYITSMWAYATSPDFRHSTHIHQNSFLSGVFYVSAPIGCGKLRFMDPRPAKGIINPEYEQINDANMGMYSVNPRKGEMIIFPSWLPHDVTFGENKIEEQRIVIAFNIMVKGTYKYHAQSIVY